MNCIDRLDLVISNFPESSIRPGMPLFEETRQWTQGGEVRKNIYDDWITGSKELDTLVFLMVVK